MSITHDPPMEKKPAGGVEAAATLDLERLAFLNEALAASAAIDAAERLGVFTRLAGGPVTPDTLARDCGIAERGAALLLTALASLGLTGVNAAGAYCLALSDPARWLHGYAKLTQVIRDDHPPVTVDVLADAASFYPDVVPLLGAMHAAAAQEAARYLAASGMLPASRMLITPGMRVLDVGAGAAPWSLALAARDPACRGCALDLPAVLPETRRAVMEAGCESQYDYLEGDLFSVALEHNACDLAIAGNICHLFDEAANLRLLGRLFEALRPGGKLVIVDALPGDHMDGPRTVALYALGLMLRTQTGRIYPFSTYTRWLEATGYEATGRIDLSAAPLLSLITARRP